LRTDTGADESSSLMRPFISANNVSCKLYRLRRSAASGQYPAGENCWRVPLVSVNVGQRLPEIRKQSVERFERAEQPGRRNANRGATLGRQGQRWCQHRSCNRPVRPPSSLCRLCFRRPPDFPSRTAGRDVRIAALNKFEPGCRYCRWRRRERTHLRWRRKSLGCNFADQ
jgi:hypothetical protein